jgi:hypothetical protein
MGGNALGLDPKRMLPAATTVFSKFDPVRSRNGGCRPQYRPNWE